MIYAIIVTLAFVAGGYYTACALGLREYKRAKKNKLTSNLLIPL